VLSIAYQYTDTLVEITSQGAGLRLGWPLHEKNQVRMRKRILLRFSPWGVAAVLLGGWVGKAQKWRDPYPAAATPPGKFVDVTTASGVHFQGRPTILQRNT
jgi:hypothetical protein